MTTLDIWKVKKDAPTEDMPFYGLNDAELVVEIEHAGCPPYTEFMNSLVKMGRRGEDYREILPEDYKLLGELRGLVAIEDGFKYVAHLCW